MSYTLALKLPKLTTLNDKSIDGIRDRATQLKDGFEAAAKACAELLGSGPRVPNAETTDKVSASRRRHSAADNA